jgi:tRNA pseudouridine32 synthase / 23S rRNA pseudouridine746 synthase
MTPQEMVSRLLYRDGLMLVIDKPTGFAVHRGPKGGESLEDHFDALRFGLPRAPSLAHRLDRDTSGCLVLGRHRKALALLGRLFKSGAVKKTYWAVVEGAPATDAGTIELPLGRLDETRGWWMKHDPDGQPAVTKWTVMGSFPPELGRSPPPCGEGSGVGAGPLAASVDDSSPSLPTPLPTLPDKGGGKHEGGGTLTWLALEPVTGRTHQLRVHCAEMGWPIVGDTIYGNAPRSGGPILHLHAREIIVPISKNRPPVRVTAPVPPHMRDALVACGWTGEDLMLQREIRDEESSSKHGGTDAGHDHQ